MPCWRASTLTGRAARQAKFSTICQVTSLRVGRARRARPGQGGRPRHARVAAPARSGDSLSQDRGRSCAARAFQAPQRAHWLGLVVQLARRRSQQRAYRPGPCRRQEGKAVVVAAGVLQEIRAYSTRVSRCCCRENRPGRRTPRRARPPRAQQGLQHGGVLEHAVQVQPQHVAGGVLGPARSRNGSRAAAATWRRACGSGHDGFRSPARSRRTNARPRAGHVAEARCAAPHRLAGCERL